ncbi:unnamed protein product (macronuclear) [Paramecium tetraurelia]|uniref:HTH myb-type domain-containing protein n=1 Tax=Paramecium tetraurelia TaxID=5888 RepID=A0D6S9_PARTE|nr:uncharacterized protein GSPATT00001787001 [Paramecium tetraurelia]CAK78746.1 unnamed protein product [Paramecium tetraurelia]|eukprot:XP_001446143.1 hypothetical protein (macronuclear) [Paramecium tetraurelia strain d4-2]
MNMTVKLIRKSKKQYIHSLKHGNESNKEQSGLQQLPNESFQSKQNVENLVYDNDSSLQSSSYNNSVGDITENFESVYSHKLMNKNHQQITKASNDSKNKQIRYTVKREKDMKRKKQKNRGKQFSQEEDQRLLNYILKKGPKFHKFARYFPGKSTNMLKNRYYKSLRFEWDQVLGSQYSYMNAPSEEITPIIQQESPVFMFDELIQLRLFPEAEDLMSNFIGNLSQTFNDLHSSFPSEDY